MTSCIGCSSDLFVPDNEANNETNNKANNEANNKALSHLCSIIYLDGGFSAFLLIYQYLHALGSMCSSNSSNFFVEAVFFCFIFALGFFFKIFISGVTSSFGSVTPKFVWEMFWLAGTSLRFSLKEKSDTILSDFCTSISSQPFIDSL